MNTDTSLSRRKLLASMPSAAAAMAPAAASAVCRLPTGADAELLALGRKLEPLVPEINAARALDQASQDKFEVKMASLGLKDESEYADHDAWFDERVRLINENPERLHELDDDDDDDHRSWDDMLDDLTDLLDEILALRPTTIEGFAVQVLAIVTMHDDLCYEDSDNESLPYGVTAFFCSMCRFVGVPLPEAAA
jgi:hypothetical protein